MSGNNDVEKVKSALDLERIISSQASDWKSEAGSAGRKGRCTHPEHGHTGSGDNAGNLIVTDEGWYCYSHDTGGDVFEWIAVEEGIVNCRDPTLDSDDFVETLRIAADRAGVELNEEADDPEDLPRKRRAEIELAEVIDHLHGELDTLVGDTTVRGKIKRERGFTDEDVDNAKVGWIDDTVYADLLNEFGPGALERTGFRSSDGNQFVSGRIIYPYLVNGVPKYWTGRATEESAFEEAKYRKPKGDCPLEQPVHTIRPPDQAPSSGLWIVEGIQDAISMASAGGVKAATAVATNPSGEQKRQLLDAARSVDRAVVCFDSDDSGVSKSVDLALDLMDDGVTTEIASVPEGDDPNDFFSGGGSFDDIEPTSAVEKIISEQGDNDETVRRIAQTVEPGTPRADRVAQTISETTPLQKRTFRKMARQTARRETQSGWKEPEQILKKGRTEIKYVFVYEEGTEIEMDNLTGQRALATFKQKYYDAFNWMPNLDSEEWENLLREWGSRTVAVEDEALSDEKLALDTVLESIQESRALPSKEDLAGSSKDYLTYYDGMLLVLRDTVLDWVDDLDIHPTLLGKYLTPIKAGDATRYYISPDNRQTFWQFDPDEIEDHGYSVPDPEPVPDKETDDKEPEEVDGL